MCMHVCYKLVELSALTDPLFPIYGGYLGIFYQPADLMTHKKWQTIDKYVLER